MGRRPLYTAGRHGLLGLWRLPVLPRWGGLVLRQVPPSAFPGRSTHHRHDGSRSVKQRSCRGCGGRLYGIGALCARCTIDQRAARAPRPKRVRRANAARNPEHLAWIRSLPCSIRGCTCRTGTQAAHVRMNTGGGMGMKPPDRWTAPLCHEHHHEQHQIGHAAFDAKYGIDLRALAAELASLSPFITESTGTSKQ